MAKSKIKKNKKKRVIKKVKPKSKKSRHKRNLGQRIKVKVMAEPKSENVYGEMMESGNKINLAPILEITDVNNNLEENREGIFQPIDAVPEILPSQETDSSLPENNEPEKIILAELPNEENASWEENDEEMANLEEEANEPIEYYEEESYREPDPFENLSLRQKNIILYVAISCVMVVIVGFWFIGLRASLSQSFKGLNLNSEDLNNIKNGFNNLGEEAAQITTQISNKASVVPELTNKMKQNVIEEQLKNDVANKMKEQLQNQNTNLNVNALNSIPK